MTSQEFLRRWDRMPELKQAELIEGVVYLAAPVSLAHGSYDSLFSSWLGHYAYVTGEDFTIATTTTLLLGSSAFQPDVALARGPEPDNGKTPYLERLPDLVVEIVYSSRSYDLGPKLAAYCSAGLPEHIAVLLEEQRVEWRVLSGTRYRLLSPPEDRILRSPNLAGLWLDTQALFPADRKRLF